MTTTPTEPRPEPAKTRNVQPPPPRRAEPETRRRSAVGRFFSRLLMLLVFAAVSFGAGYFVMDQEARLHREAFRQEQSAAQDRIAALEEQIREMQLARAQENSVEIDLTDVFAPIKAAVSRLAEAQMSIVAQQISIEVARRADLEVQNLNASAPLAAIAETAAAAIAPAIVAMPPAGTTVAAPPPEPAAETAPDEPPGDPAAGPAPIDPGAGGPPPDRGPAAPADDAPAQQSPAAALSGAAQGGGRPAAGPIADGSPGRLPQWLLRLADTLDGARERLDAATAAPLAGEPSPQRLGRAALGG